MEIKKGKMVQLQQMIALGAGMIIAVQVILTLIGQPTVCLNEGCRIIERLTTISPLYLNLLGFFYFQAVFWGLRLFRNVPLGKFDVPGLLLVAGLAAESVLFSYQVFVAKTLCSYCMLIFTVVLVLNILHGLRQTVYGFAIFAAAIVSFSILNFLPPGITPNNFSLKLGVYGVKKCSEPSKEIYLIFSEDCPHCRNVIHALENCSSCDLYLNPIDRISSLHLEGLVQKATYIPEVNRLMLALFNIEEVPVLLTKSQNGYAFIKGEQKIIHYVRQSCFTQNPLWYSDESVSGQKDINIITDEQDECSVQVDCKE
jgi:uncharacterized membrane protein